MSYTPKPGTGWETVNEVVDGHRVYFLDTEPSDPDGEMLIVTVGEDDQFDVALSPLEGVYQCPWPQHIQRIELDFGVQAWSVKGVSEFGLRLVAVKVRGA